MKLYTFVVYNLSMCMKAGNQGVNNIKGDNYLWVMKWYILIWLTI